MIKALVPTALTGGFQLSAGKPARGNKVACTKSQGGRPLDELVERKCSCTFFVWAWWGYRLQRTLVQHLRVSKRDARETQASQRIFKKKKFSSPKPCTLHKGPLASSLIVRNEEFRQCGLCVRPTNDVLSLRY